MKALIQNIKICDEWYVLDFRILFCEYYRYSTAWTELLEHSLGFFRTTYDATIYVKK